MLDRLLPRRPEAAEPEPLLATTDLLPGFTLTETLTVVGAAGGDEASALRALARRGATVEADAVVGVRVVTTATGGFWVSNRESFACGTAVRVTPHPPA